MRPEKNGLEVEQDDLFRSRLSSIFDHKHLLYVLAEAIDWQTLEREFGAFYVEKVGRLGLTTRLMAGLQNLKHARAGSRVYLEGKKEIRVRLQGFGSDDIKEQLGSRSRCIARQSIRRTHTQSSTHASLEDHGGEAGRYLRR